MAKSRRGLTEALDLTPEKVAFIRQERTLGTEAIVESPRPEPLEHRGEGASAESTVALGRPVEEPSKVASERATTPRSVGPHNQALVPLTTRLQPATAAALRRAYLERKLAGVEHATQQEIVEEALQDWLRSTGFLD